MLKGKKKKSDNVFKESSICPTVSCDIVRYLKSQGMTLKQIGVLMNGLSESFICRVLNKKRSFTLQHLSNLEEALGKPLPLIIIEATQLETVPKKLQKAYMAFSRIMAELTDINS